MAEITKLQAVQLARKAGTKYVNRNYPGQTGFGFTDESLLTFAQACFKLGRNAGLEEAAQLARLTVCDTHLPTGTKIYGSRAASAIESLKDNT